MSFVNTLDAETNPKSRQRIWYNFCFESLSEETLKNKRLSDPVCRNNSPPRGACSKEANLPF